MNVFFTSDHHFFHENIIKYCGRPFSDVDHMNCEMLSSLNSAVEPEDLVIFVGDLTASLKNRYEELLDIIHAIKCRKILIRGNHDHLADEWYLSAGFEKVLTHINLGGVLLVHYPLVEAISRGLDTSYLGSVEHVIHGHTHHANTPNHENHFNVAVDRHDFCPVNYRNAMPDHLQLSFLDALGQLL